jgi:hypothetical protein
LHTDPLIVREWLDDDISWRDVFLPKKAPNVTPYEYLEMLANGTSPYWDDTDQNNKRWVFPGRPDLEELANNRQRNLDADEDNNFEQASDLNEVHTSKNVTIGNITEQNVAKYEDDAVSLKQEALKDTATVTTPSTEDDNVDDNDVDNDPDADGDDDYSDLPF